MACKKCACGVTEDEILKKSYKDINEFLNQTYRDDICPDTEEKIKDWIDKSQNK